MIGAIDQQSDAVQTLSKLKALGLEIPSPLLAPR
jgi:hypothetical protein